MTENPPINERNSNSPPWRQPCGSVVWSPAAQEEVQLAAQAEAERGVEEGRHERDRRGDRYAGWDTERGEEQSDRDDQQADELGEAWGPGVLELGRRGLAVCPGPRG